MATLDALLDELFDGGRPALREEMARWAGDSRRFTTFATTYRAKIRAKLRNAPNDAARLDVRAELHAAALLLRDERFNVAYETYAAAKQRGPDFTVTFRAHTPFSVEVRRLRGVELDGDAEARLNKLTAVLCDKVGQMPPSIVNLLWLSGDDGLAAPDVSTAATTLRRLAEGKDDAFFTRRGFEGAADFLRQFQRLSGVMWPLAEACGLWLNPLARHRTPGELGNALRRLSM